jgi:antitoxin YefM
VRGLPLRRRSAQYSARVESSRDAVPGTIWCRRALARLNILAILIAMSVDQQMPLKDVKNHLSEVVDKVEREHDRVVITKHGRPAAVVLSIADLESLEETLDVLGRPRLIAQIHDSLAELDRHTAQILSKEQALALRG